MRAGGQVALDPWELGWDLGLHMCLYVKLREVGKLNALGGKWINFNLKLYATS